MKTKMNKITLLLFFIIGMFTGFPAYAQTPTVSEALDEKLNSQINQLKDKIASRVSELNLVEKRGITGIVSEASTNQITLKDLNGNTRLIDIDEITKFSSGSSSSNFGVSDLKEGDRLNVLGLYNKESKRLLARFVSTAVNPVFLSGAISAIDKEEFTIDLLTADKKTTKIDVNTSTRTFSYEDGDLVKSGFSQLETADRIMMIGLPDKTDPNLIVAERVLVLPTLPKNPNINITQATKTPGKP